MACIEKITYSAEETVDFGRKLGKHLKPGSIVCFFGDLAAGKTTFIKGLVGGSAGETWEPLVNSPTFVYLNIYEGNKTVYHFDLYRLNDFKEFIGMGFDEYFTANGICLLEWAEKIETVLPEECILIKMQHEGESSRRITINHFDGNFVCH